MAQFPSDTSASDVWSLRDVYKAEAGDEWPTTIIPYGNWSLASASHVGQDTSPTGNSSSFSFSRKGTKFYHAPYNTQTIYESDVSTAWDTSTLSLVSGNTIAAGGSVFDTHISYDGYNIYACIYNTGIRQYTLSTAFDLSTASLTTTLTAPTLVSNSVGGVYLSDDGTRMIVVEQATDTFSDYTLSTPWDLTTATKNGQLSIGAYDTHPRCVVVHPDGGTIFVQMTSGNTIDEWSLATPWTVSSGASYVREISYSSDAGTSGMGLDVKRDGTKLYVGSYATVDIDYWSI